MNGYIETLDGAISDDDRTYNVAGRDKTCDIIDCSAPQTTTAWAKGITIMNLANQLSKGMGIKFSWGAGITSKQQRAIPFTLERGETIFESLDRMAAKAGCLLIPDGRGGVVFTVRGETRASDKLIEGVNAKNFSFKKSYAERFSEYTIEGTENNSMAGGPGGYGGDRERNAETETEGDDSPPNPSVHTAKATDSNIRRFRPTYVQRRGSNDQMSIEEYAEQEAQIRAGKSLSISCTVQGWAQSNGKPWTINQLVKVTAPRLGIGNEFGDEYLISETEFTISSSGGSVTQMVLLPPDAFIKQKKVDKKKRDQKGLGWDAPRGPRPKTLPPLGTKKPGK